MQATRKFIFFSILSSALLNNVSTQGSAQPSTAAKVSVVSGVKFKPTPANEKAKPEGSAAICAASAASAQPISGMTHAKIMPEDVVQAWKALGCYDVNGEISFFIPKGMEKRIIDNAPTIIANFLHEDPANVHARNSSDKNKSMIMYAATCGDKEIRKLVYSKKTKC